MKKFFYSAAVALALFAADARAAHFQSGSVRVGPAADEPAVSATSAPAPSKDEKKAPAADDAKPARHEQSHEAGKKKQQPSKLSNSTASAVTPGVKGEHSSTTDAPPRPASEADVPLGAPVKTSSGAEGAIEANKSPAPATPNSSVPPLTNGLASPAKTAAPAASLESVYRLGIGDVLDIRLLNGQDPRQSTLYPVLAGGVLDYPLLRDPLTVAGMTTDELAAQLIAEFRHRGLYERPQVRVSVREYASHAVLVSGLVNDPGTKILRREAIPLYVVVAEAQPKPEAGRAVVISHSTGRVLNVDLNDAASLNTLVQSGDVVTLTVRPPEFFYIGGEIASPGQKDFHAGMTLTQGLLASGGVTRMAGDRVRVSRQGADGRLVSTEYNLREIEGGAIPDPPLQAGDRVEVPARRK